MSEKTKEIIQTIRDLAEILRPYVDTTKGLKSHSYILFWWGNMLTIASLIEHQEIPITKNQKKYLLKQLFGGMGSFNDFSLSDAESGEGTENVNKKLCEVRASLYKLIVN